MNTATWIRSRASPTACGTGRPGPRHSDWSALLRCPPAIRPTGVMARRPAHVGGAGPGVGHHRVPGWPRGGSTSPMNGTSTRTAFRKCPRPLWGSSFRATACANSAGRCARRTAGRGDCPAWATLAAGAGVASAAVAAVLAADARPDVERILEEVRQRDEEPAPRHDSRFIWLGIFQSTTRPSVCCIASATVSASCTAVIELHGDSPRVVAEGRTRTMFGRLRAPLLAAAICACSPAPALARVEARTPRPHPTRPRKPHPARPRRTVDRRDQPRRHVRHRLRPKPGPDRAPSRRLLGQRSLGPGSST